MSEEHLTLNSRGGERDLRPWDAVQTPRGREQPGSGLRPVAKAVLGQPRERDAVRKKEPRRAKQALPSRRETAGQRCR